MNFFISEAYAQDAAGAGASLQPLILMVLMIAVFYFLLFRPQQKKAKEHRQMVENLKKGDELVTGGGVLGRVTEVGENFVMLEIAANVKVKVQKNAVATLVPKGTVNGDL